MVSWQIDWHYNTSIELTTLYYFIRFNSNFSCYFVVTKKSGSKEENGQVMDEECIWYQGPTT